MMASIGPQSTMRGEEDIALHRAGREGRRWGTGAALQIETGKSHAVLQIQSGSVCERRAKPTASQAMAEVILPATGGHSIGGFSSSI